MAHGQGGAEIGFDRGPTLTCNHEAPIVATALTASRSATQCPNEDTTLIPMTTHTLRGEGFDASEDGTGRGTPLVPVAQPYSIMPMNSGKDYKARPTDVAQPLMAGGPVGGNQGGDFIVQPIALQDVTPRDKAQNGRGWNDDGTAYTVDTHATQGVAQPIAFSAKDHGADATADLSPTLRAMGHASSHANGGGQMAVAQPIPFDTTQITSPANVSNPKAGDPCHPLAAGAHAPAIALGADMYNGQITGDVAATLSTRSGDGVSAGPSVLQPYTLAVRGRGDTHNLEYRQDGTANALLTPNGGRAGIGVGAIAFHPTQDPISSAEVSHSIGANENATAAVCFDDPRRFNGPHGGFEHGDIHPTLENTNPKQIALTAMQVRRLTPVECERLQGFPDGYTAIPWRGKPADQCPDGPRYKALGNSWAVPVVRWIGERINAAVNAAEAKRFKDAA